MKYYDAIETANKTAAMLRDKEKCDLVVAVTHIGYEAIPKAKPQIWKWRAAARI